MEHKWRLDSRRPYEFSEGENQGNILKERNPAACEGGGTCLKGGSDDDTTKS